MIEKSAQLSLTLPVRIPWPWFQIVNCCCEELPTLTTPKLRDAGCRTHSGSSGEKQGQLGGSLQLKVKAPPSTGTSLYWSSTTTRPTP